MKKNVLIRTLQNINEECINEIIAYDNDTLILFTYDGIEVFKIKENALVKKFILQESIRELYLNSDNELMCIEHNNNLSILDAVTLQVKRKVDHVKSNYFYNYFKLNKDIIMDCCLICCMFPRFSS